MSLGLTRPSFFQNPYPVYAELRARRGPVFDEAMHSWIISRFADVESLLRDSRISKKIQREEKTAFETSVLFRDPPDHGRIRGLLNQAFAALPENLESRVQRIADDLISRMLTRHSTDFMQDFALPLPVAVIAEVLGIPQADTEHLHAWSSEFILDDGVVQAEKDRRQYAAICGMDGYFRRFIDSGQADGLIGTLLSTNTDGEQLSEDELVGNCILLMVAGHETTVNLLGNGLYLLLAEPDRLQRVKKDPKLLAPAIEEILRYESPVQLGTFRVATEAIEIGGCTIEAGAMITAAIGAANRDPDEFPDPDTFDMTRTPNRHLGFGFGPHRCIGAQLARAEARIGLARLFEQLPGLSLAVEPRGWLGNTLARFGVGAEAKPRQPQWRQTAITRGHKELMISF